MSMISEQIEELRLMAEMFVNGEPYGNLLRRAANTIEMLSEKAREPKRGEWINTAEPYMSDNIVCSVCGYNSICEYNFCPNCGADMRGEKDETD